MKNINIKIMSLVITFLLLFSGAVSAAPYTIKDGDTLWEIAQRYGTGTDALMKANNLKIIIIKCRPKNSST